MAVPKKRKSKLKKRTNQAIWYRKVLQEIKKVKSLYKTLLISDNV